MKRAERLFRREAERCSSSGEGAASEWMLDNFYLLSGEARQAIAECRVCPGIPVDKNGLPLLFTDCFELCRGGVLPEQEALKDYFCSRGLTGGESQSLAAFLRAAVLEYAAMSCVKKENEKYRSNAVKSLRRLQETDFEDIIGAANRAEKYLLLDPEGIYPAMDDESKAIYRRELSRLAEKSSQDEESFAKEALRKAQSGKTVRERHIGSAFISEKPLRLRGAVFAAAGEVIPVLLAVLAAVLLKKAYLFPLLWLPLRQIFLPIVDSLSLKGVSPKYFFRLKAEDERVKKANVMITVSTLLPPAGESDKLKKRLESLMQSNLAPNVGVCCLADFKASGTSSRPEDEPALAAAARVTQELNRKYSGGFVLAVRPRTFSETQQEFTGRERKRGAITALVNAINGDEREFRLISGDKERLRKSKYILVLDSDTGTVFDCASSLVSVAEHPLNMPVIDKKRGTVTEGYGILAPCVRQELNMTSSTAFCRLLTGGGGISVYDTAATEKFQDLFGESVFSGKGLINVEAYRELLADAFPAERVLSHDVLEGGYLRTGFVADLQLTEGFPSRRSSYLLRLGRWVRGDWQNIRFIFSKNPLKALHRKMLADNIIRCVEGPAALAAIIISVFLPERAGEITALAALISAAAGELHTFVRSLTGGGFSVFSRLYYSETLPAALGALVRAFLNVVMLPGNAFCAFKSGVLAVFRMAVSKRNLLQWTTAAQSEKSSAAAKDILVCLPSVITGIFLLVFGSGVQRLGGILFLLDFPFSLLSARKYKQREFFVNDSGRERLISYASAMWGYFDEFCNESNNYLPPDNFQEAPVKRLAGRTSPTNIGLMLLSVLAARDLGLITTRDMCERLNKSLESVCRLKKYRGNLFNWYSTVTLEPLAPEFVSTVDSGNFLCCLTALKSGLAEYGGEEPALRKIEETVGRLLEQTDLLPLYNPRRKLFYIGVDSSGKPSGNCYDLFMSEARMTAYYAVAKRITDKRHWAALGRILVGEGRYTGLVSWTGTMFEYFMPHIFIPSPAGSLSAESLKFCLFCQRKRTGNGVWGISESGFYTFDSLLNYQYKAHGAAKIGLKRGLEKELVISPYSSFLTLTAAPEASLKNLKRLEKMGMTGKYGFYEAADMTPGRAEPGGAAIVRSFMAHHIGMSFLSVDNVLNNNIIQRRFMADDAMAGARSLLYEKVPNGARVFKDIEPRSVPKIRERTERHSSAPVMPDISSPRVRIYSNGRWSTEISDCGTGVSMLDGDDLTVRSRDNLRRPQGIFAVFSTAGEAIPFVSCLDRESSAQFRARFNEREAVHTAKKGDILLKMQTAVMRNSQGERRKLTVENLSGKNTVEGELTVYFEPCLAGGESFSSHPVFSKLFIDCTEDEENVILLFRRRAREGEAEICLAAGFERAEKCETRLGREQVLCRPHGIFSLCHNSFGEKGKSSDPCAAFSIKIKLKPHEKAEKTLILCAAQSESEAKNELITLRSRLPSERFAADPFYHRVLDSAIASHILPAVFYPCACDGRGMTGEREFSLADLWSFGISGDKPIILTSLEARSGTEEIRPFIRVNKLLRSCSVPTDLVIAFREEPGYDTPVLDSVRRALRDEECEIMLGVSGGVHAVNLNAHTPEQCAALVNASVFDSRSLGRVPGGKTAAKPLRRLEPCLPCGGEGIEWLTASENADSVKLYSFTEGKFEVKTEQKTACTTDIREPFQRPESFDVSQKTRLSALDDPPWCLPLSGKSLGTLVSDKAVGFTWALNSRENKLTPWFNDPCSDNCGELVAGLINGKIRDLTAGARAVFTNTGARWYGVSDKIEHCISVTVPERGMTKRISVNLKNTGEHRQTVLLAFYCEPVLGVRPDTLHCFSGKRVGSGAVFRDYFSQTGGFCSVLCRGGADSVCFSRRDFFAGDWDETAFMPLRSPCAAVIRKIELPAGISVQTDFFLSFGVSERSALKMPELSFEPARLAAPLKIKTGREKLDLLNNSFLYQQIKASRFLGRTGFYQCGGAFGFRDQLQDCLALLYGDPELVRVHILRCCAVQFLQGDVLHWWHIIPGASVSVRGVRTRCSDDLLWLPFVVSEYAAKTGDYSILRVKVPYIEGEELSAGETERYFHPKRSTESETVLAHCVMAAKRSMNFGENSLPLIGSGDWNDGMNRLPKGTESVWLAEFSIIVFEALSRLCRYEGDNENAELLSDCAETLRGAVGKSGFDGEKFIRAVGPTGEPMKTVDILPQAFASFACAANSEKRKSALLFAEKELVDKQTGLVRLLSPPFPYNRASSVGYIASYPPGIRENGGQYTHAAVWLAAAFFKEGMEEKGRELLELINPANICSEKSGARRYRGEPFALAGDVSAGELCGRAGWTLYTGSVAWYYVTVIEKMLGIRLRNGRITLPEQSKAQTAYNEQKNEEKSGENDFRQGK